MSDAEKYAPPPDSLIEQAEPVTRTLIQMIPVVGGIINELYTSVVAPQIRKRQADWMENIAEGLRQIEEKQVGFIDSLKEDDVFLDSLLQASQSAIRTSQQEKRDALRNAVLNSALPHAPDITRQTLFLAFVDGFDALHLWMLAFLDDPVAWLKQLGRKQPNLRTDKLFELVYFANPELESEEALCESVCRDLSDKGLLIATSLRKSINRFPYEREKPREKQAGYRFRDELPSDMQVANVSSPTALRNWTTELGRQFLAFIAAPNL